MIKYINQRKKLDDIKMIQLTTHLQSTRLHSFMLIDDICREKWRILVSWVRRRIHKYLYLYFATISETMYSQSRDTIPYFWNIILTQNPHKNPFIQSRLQSIFKMTWMIWTSLLSYPRYFSESIRYSHIYPFLPYKQCPSYIPPAFVRAFLIPYTRILTFTVRFRPLYSQVLTRHGFISPAYLNTQPRYLSRNHGTSSLIFHPFNDIGFNKRILVIFYSPFFRVTTLK